MLIVIAAIAVVWASISVLVWAACAAASRADAAGLAPGVGAYDSQRSSQEAAERLTVWDSLPGLPVRDTKLRPHGAR
jgi:hypothetical protein